MDTINVGNVLRKYRKQNQLTVSDVVVELRNYNVNVAEKTLYGWENNQAKPRSDAFVALCDIYKINNINEAFHAKGESKSFFITPEERALIQNYRNHPDMQKAVRALLKM